MYAVIRRYKVKPGSGEELARRAQQGFVPIVQGIPGFVAYYGIQSGNDEIATVSVFETREGEEESTRKAAEWVAQNVAEFIEGRPEISSGMVTWSGNQSQTTGGRSRTAGQ